MQRKLCTYKSPANTNATTVLENLVKLITKVMISD